MSSYESNTVASPPKELLEISILKRRDEVVESIENYNRFHFGKAKYPSNILKSRIFSYFSILRSGLKRSLGKDWVEKAQETIEDGKVKDIINLFYEIEDYLDEVKITRLDTRTVYDKTRVEDENEDKNL